MEKKKIKSMMFFQNGNVAVFNNKGNQISEFQGSYVLDLIEKIEQAELSPTPTPTCPKMRRLKENANFGKCLFNK